MSSLQQWVFCAEEYYFSGWRLDPILQFGQFLLAGTTVFFAYESVRLRGVATDQARRSSYFEEDPVPNMPRNSRNRFDEYDQFDEPERISGDLNPKKMILGMNTKKRDHVDEMYQEP